MRDFVNQVVYGVDLIKVYRRDTQYEATYLLNQEGVEYEILCLHPNAIECVTYAAGYLHGYRKALMVLVK